jgi:zinc protease
MQEINSRSVDSVQYYLDNIGASVNFLTERHRICFSAICLAEDLEVVIRIIIDTLKMPEFGHRMVDQTRNKLISTIHIKNNECEYVADKIFRQVLYKNHLYQQPIIGEVETISSITNDNITTFYQDYYGPQNLIIAIVGAVIEDKMRDLIEGLLSNWTAKSAKEELLRVPNMPWPSKMLRISKKIPGKSLSTIIVGLPGPCRLDSNYHSTQVANAILGGRNNNNRLFNRIRNEEGLAYWIHSYLSSSKGPSPWMARTQIFSNKADEVISIILEEIKSLQNFYVSNSELEITKSYLIGSMLLNLETNISVASYIADMEYYDLGLDYLHVFQEELSNLSQKDVQTSARKNFSIEQIAVAIAGH